jgi:DNA invertase Pin-like site-specific DNA recombinase
MISHKKVGTIGEAKTLAKLSEYGIDCYLPFNEDTKSDIVADINGTLTRIQIKTSNRIVHNSLIVKIQQSGNHEAYLAKDVDYFVIYNMIDDELYMITRVDTEKYAGKSVSIKIRYDRAIYRDTLQSKDILIDDVLTRDLKVAKIISENCSDTTKISEADSALRKKSKKPSKDAMVDLLKEYKISEIADIFNVTGQTIRKWCAELGIEISEYTRECLVEKTCALCGKKFMTKDKSRKFCSKECLDNRGLVKVDLNDVIKMHKAGSSMREIGRKYGVHHKMISKFLKKFDENPSYIKFATEIEDVKQE